MKKLVVIGITLVLSVGVLAACSAGTSSSTSTSSPESSASVESSAASSASASSVSSSASTASSNAVAPASSDAVSSDVARAGSSDVAQAGSSDAVRAGSSDAAKAGSSDAVSSNAASSGAASSLPVLSGPSGLAEMDVPMQYISAQDVLNIVEKKDKTKVIVDLRKPEDTAQGHIEGAIFAPMNNAVDQNNYSPAIVNITDALSKATENEIGGDKEIILVCYRGVKYAQAATDILNALGADMGNVYTLEGGMEAWDKAGYPTTK